MVRKKPLKQDKPDKLQNNAKASNDVSAKTKQRRATNRLARVRAEAKTQLSNINEALEIVKGGAVYKEAIEAKKELEKFLDQSFLKDNKRYKSLKTQKGKTNFVNRLAEKLSNKIDAAVAERAEADVFIRKEAMFKSKMNTNVAMLAFFWGSSKDMWYRPGVDMGDRYDAIIRGLQNRLDKIVAQDDRTSDYVKQVGVDRLKENMSLLDAFEILMRMHDLDYSDFDNPEDFMEYKYKDAISGVMVVLRGLI